jgi:hypothetical protein
MITGYAPAPSNAALTTSWLARLRRGVHAERKREHARIKLWEYEGGSLFHPRHVDYERYRTDAVALLA